MGKIYYVNIKGRTLESRNLKELLARAVSTKRNMDQKYRMQVCSGASAFAANSGTACVGSCS